MAKDYEVGYGRPPKHSRFRKGESGNPKGRPKGAKSFRTEFLEELGETIQVREDGRTRRISKQRAAIKQLMAKAIKGDARAVTALFTMLVRLAGAEEVQGGAAEAPLTETDREILERFLRSHLKEVEENDG